MVIAVVRTIILYLIIIFGIRLLGKHQVGELEPAEFVLALIIADIASVPMQGLRYSPAYGYHPYRYPSVPVHDFIIAYHEKPEAARHFVRCPQYFDPGRQDGSEGNAP